MAAQASEARLMATPNVAVIIVNYNSGAYLRRCIDALERQTYRDFETIVVDNASTDGSEQAAEGRTRLIRAGANVGFPAGNNLGLKHASPVKWVALLNPDAFPEPEWLERFVGAAEANPQFAFFGCRMLLAATPDVLDGTADVYHLSGASWRRDHGTPASQGASQPDEIFGPCAAAALYLRSALDEVGGLDERYFCYHEDVDLSFRLRLRGHRCRYVPDAIVHHVSSGITGRRSDFATYHGHRNLVWTYVKDMPAALLWLTLPLHLAFNLVAIVVCGIRGQLAVILRAKRDAIRGLSAAWRERRAIQANRRVDVATLLASMAKGLRRR